MYSKVPPLFPYNRIYKFLRLKNLGISRARSFCINGGITVTVSALASFFVLWTVLRQ